MIIKIAYKIRQSMFCGASVKMWLFVVNNLCLLHFVLVALRIILFSLWQEGPLLKFRLIEPAFVESESDAEPQVVFFQCALFKCIVVKVRDVGLDPLHGQVDKRSIIPYVFVGYRKGDSC